ncbi:MAG: hypothetical protein KBS96_07450 [Lachnospiraceae bacterium]|nr:hypothetical protein [Candidatus Colinaster scatohippi]
MTKEVQGLKIKNVIFNIIIGVLVIAFIISFAIMLHSVRTRRYAATYELRQLNRYVTAGDYCTLVEAWKSNIKNGITEKTNPEYSALYAVAEYYYLLPEYKVYLEQGYADKCKTIEETLKNDREKMAELSMLADEFDALYGLK